MEQSDELISAIMFCFACMPARCACLPVCPAPVDGGLRSRLSVCSLSLSGAGKIYEPQHIAPIPERWLNL